MVGADLADIPSDEHEDNTAEDSCEEEDESSRELEVLRQHVAMLNSELFQLKRVSRGGYCKTLN